MTTAESEHCFSKLKKANIFLQNTACNGHLSALAIMSINKNRVQDTDNFDDKVSEKFISIENRRMEFTFNK